MIAPDRFKDISAFVDFSTTDIAPKLVSLHAALTSDPSCKCCGTPCEGVKGLTSDQAVEVMIHLLNSIIAVPSPVESK